MSKKLLTHTLQDFTYVDLDPPNVQPLSDDGVWMDITSWKRATVHVKWGGTFVADKIEIFGSNTPTKPANGTDHVQLGSDFTASGLYEVTAKVKWIKAKVTNSTAGSAQVYVVGDSTVYGV